MFRSLKSFELAQGATRPLVHTQEGRCVQTEAGCVLCQPGAGGAGKRPPHTADGVSKARVAAQPGVGGGGDTPIPGRSRSERVGGAGLRVLSAW